MRQIKRIRKVWVTFALGAALVAESLAMTAPTANALAGNCSAWLDNGVGYTRGVGKCSSLASDTKARVTLDIANAPDRHSAWFTTLNVTYKTPIWSSTQAGWPRVARVDHAKR